MHLNFSPEDEQFREEIADFLNTALNGQFSHVKNTGGHGSQLENCDARLEWERFLGSEGWSCIGYPTEWGGRGASLAEQVIYAEEYARAGGPGKITHIGQELAGPTILAFGSDDVKKRFIPDIVGARKVWCQGYSEPGAGSDLANVRTKAYLDAATNEWVIEGQKTWTSFGDIGDWCFVVTRTEPGTKGHKGLSYLLVPMDQDGVDPRPIRQMTGDAEFSEVFYDGARTSADNIVGEPGAGWPVAMGTLSFERGVSTLGQQMSFRHELDTVIAIAKENGKAKDPVMRQRIADAWIGLKIMRYNSMRMLSNADSGTLQREALIYKLFWATWHRDLGKLAMDVLGDGAEIGEALPYDLTELQKMFLFTRADTIYAGTNQIQRNIIAERALGMPREPRPQ